MRESVWDILGIAMTFDERAIKRAYAAKLRIHSPEADPAGYMKLREAYEAAKRYAERMRERPSEQEPEQEQTERPLHSSPVVVTPEERAPTAQQQALAALRSLLAAGQFDDFVRKLDEIRAAGVFATLDEQQDFIGEIAVMVHDTEVQDLDWCGKLAAHLGAREHENVFQPGSEYWHAYQELLNAYVAVRQMAVRTRVASADEITKTPGYLHVYNVLTSPFDSERMSALTRSQTYYRLAETLLERARKDPSIVIPPGNREWWERTAMAGLHRPMANSTPVQATAPTPSTGSGRSALWILWPLVMLMLGALRTCSFDTGSSSSGYLSSTAELNSRRMEEIRQLADGKMPEGPPTTTELLVTENLPHRGFSGCDPQTRAALISHLRRVPWDPNVPPSAGSRQHYLKWNLVLDESDPAVAALLSNCASGSDSNLPTSISDPSLPANFWMKKDPELFRRMSQCDPGTRTDVYRYLLKARREQLRVNADGTSPKGVATTKTIAGANDQEVIDMLNRCRPPA